jgi:hypothetical protein
VPILATLIKTLAVINKGLMNGGFLVDEGLLIRSIKAGITRNSIFLDFQSLCGLDLSSKESPRIIGAEGIIMVAKIHFQKNGFVGNVSKRQGSSDYYLYMHRVEFFNYKNLIKSCESLIQKANRGSII